MLKALPGEFKAQGHKSRKTGEVSVRFAAGEGVDPARAAILQSFLSQPRYSILHRVGTETEPLTPFTEELRARDYDLATFRLSVFLKSAARPIPRVQLIRGPPGVLHCRWARVEFDGPDMCSAWHRPCRRADSALWQGLLSMSTIGAQEFLRGADVPTWGEGGLLGTLKRFGFDERTLRFAVRSSLPLHPDDVPVKPEPDATLVAIGEDDCPAFKKRCPVCGSQEGQACTQDDPVSPGLGMELGNRFHASRFA